MDPCFPDVELVALSGGREHVEPAGLFAHDGGWLALYEASSHGGASERSAVFLDRSGRITARQALGVDDVNGARAVLGRFLLAAQYDRTRLYEITGGTLTDRTELLDPMPPARIAAVEREGDRLRILSATYIDPTAGSFRFAYSEIVLGEDGALTTHTAELPSVESIGSPALVDGLSRYHQIHSFAMHQDSFLFAYPTGEVESDVAGQPWNVVRVALDRSGLQSGEVSWSVIDERRWAEGPISIFGALVDLDLAIAGRFAPVDGGTTLEGELTAERVTDPAASAIRLGAPGDFPPSQVGPASVLRRGDVLAVATPSRFRVLSIPTLEERASTPLELYYGIVAWGDDVVLEMGSVRSEDGLRGVLRCHTLRTDR